MSYFLHSGAKVPGSESSTYGTFALGSQSTWERKFQLLSPTTGQRGGRYDPQPVTRSSE